MVESLASLRAAIQPYLGAPYRWSVDGLPAIEPGAPFWYQQKVPTPEEVHRGGCNCVGFLNIVLGLLGSTQRFTGTRDCWKKVADKVEFLQDHSIVPPWSVLVGDYIDEDHQGHVAIVLEGESILHSYVDDGTPREGLFPPGICHQPSWKESHQWWSGPSGGVYTGWIPLLKLTNV